MRGELVEDLVLVLGYHLLPLEHQYLHELLVLLQVRGYAARVHRAGDEGPPPDDAVLALDDDAHRARLLQAADQDEGAGAALAHDLLEGVVADVDEDEAADVELVERGVAEGVVGLAEPLPEAVELVGLADGVGVAEEVPDDPVLLVPGGLAVAGLEPLGVLGRGNVKGLVPLRLLKKNGLELCVEELPGDSFIVTEELILIKKNKIRI